MKRIPSGIASARLAGILFEIGIEIFHAAQHQTAIVLVIFFTYLIAKRFVPLFIVAMASQNVPGIAGLRADGYTTPSAPLISATGIVSLLLAPFGSHGVNLAAICTGREAHEDSHKRYTAAVWCGVFYLIAGTFGATIAALFASFPQALVVSVAALALFGSIMRGFTNAMSDARQREPALVTFMVMASGLTLLSIGSAFWGLIAGIWC